MKLSRNIMILFGSYLGAVALVAMVGRFTVSPLGNKEDVPSGEQDVFVDVTDPAETDLPVAVTPDGETDAPTVETNGETDIPETDETPAEPEKPTVYYLKTVTGEDGTGTNAIGVYNADGALLDVLSTPAFALPSSDRALLENGIEVVGDEALAAVLEDFGG